MHYPTVKDIHMPLSSHYVMELLLIFQAMPCKDGRKYIEHASIVYDDQRFIFNQLWGQKAGKRNQNRQVAPLICQVLWDNNLVFHLVSFGYT